MTKAQRILNIFAGLGMIAGALLFALFPTDAYRLITGILAVTLLIAGIRMLVFYIRMARHMVGGRTILYRAIIIIDLGVFTMSLTSIPLIYVVLYLAGLHLFTGAVDILRANEARGIEGHWKLTLVHGVVNVLLAILCLVFLKSTIVAVEIYSAGLAWSGVIRIIQAFRKQAIVYVQ